MKCLDRKLFTTTFQFGENLTLEAAHQQAVDWVEKYLTEGIDVVIHTTMTEFGPQTKIMDITAAEETSAAFLI